MRPFDKLRMRGAKLSKIAEFNSLSSPIFLMVSLSNHEP
jgi:hypothetical protein